MDIQRKSGARKRRIRRAIYAVAAVGAIALVTLGVSRLKPAAPSVERSTIWPDTVKRGSMLRQVRGNGTLVPEEIRWIAATTAGRVEQILVKPGAVVQPDTVLIVLSNPEAEQAALEATSRLRAAEADYTALRVRLESQRLDQRATAATVQADYSQAKLQADTDEKLFKDGLLPELNHKLSKVRAEELSTRHEIEQKRQAIIDESIQAQLAVQQAQVEQLRALAQLRRRQVEDLRVRAGIAGVLQQLGDQTPLQVGQQVTPGTNLARVAEPRRLKAELKIAETQAKDILLGQPVSVDTRNGVVPGHVVRIDPAVQNGTVTVDVALDGELPKGARPDLSVDGTIELERLEDVLYVQRPAFGQENSQITLFKIEPDGKTAVRTKVKLGRSSVTHIEILEGLQAGDQVILSDTSAWDNFDRIRLN
jgi:HlyD family secretion protein